MVVGQVEVVVTPSLNRSDLAGPEEEVATLGEEVEDEPSSEDEDNMPSTTRLVAHLSLRSARNTMGTRGTPE